MLPSHQVAIERLITRTLLTCTPDTPLRHAAHQMALHRCSAIVVIDDGRPVGIWTEHDALDPDAVDPLALSRPIGERMSHPVQTLRGDMPVGEAAIHFKRHGIRHALVVDAADTAIGMLSQSDIVLNQGAEFFLRLKSVDSVLGPLPPTLAHDRPLTDALARMREHDTDAVLVGFGDGGLGILTQRDVVRQLAEGQPRARIGEIASRPLRTVTRGASLYAARQLFVEHHIRHLGVVDGEGVLCGLIGFGDILGNIEFEYVHELQNALRERDEALWSSRYHLRLADKVFESTLEGIMVTNANGVIERVNPAFTRLTGYSAEEAIGQRASLLSSGRQPPEFYAELWRALREDGFWQGEIWNRRKDGELYLEHLTISGIRDEDGGYSHYAAVFADITQRRLAEERLSYLATHDALTGLPNRALFGERLERALSRALRMGRRMALLFIDLDRFKLVNDTLGHGTGDKLLKAAAERLRDSVRKSDTVARMGGDEFTVILEEIGDVQHVAQIAQKLVDAVGAPCDIDGAALSVTPSIGISIAPDDGRDPQQLLTQADRAMYRIKQDGKNGFRFFTQDMNESTHDRLRLEHDLRRALENDALTLHYQPRLSLADGRVVGVEALLRWPHPTHGMVPPSEFIPIAEESGIIVALGEWVLRRACRDARGWLDAGRSPGRVAVNVSARQLLHGDFFDGLLQGLADAGLPATALELELTESMALTGHAQAHALLQAVADRGVSLAVDDFGTGYSSFEYLSSLPIDTLKIDRSLLRGPVPDARARGIIRAIVAMAEALGLSAVMEGVETAEQADFLREIGCPQVQGFFYARPMPEPELRKWLAAQAAGVAAMMCPAMSSTRSNTTSGACARRASSRV
jgi:diguanylate cyclase (GGDEF)-like protein/PAS domain S-box-containing protein